MTKEAKKTPEQLQAEIDQLKAENEQLKQAPTRTISMKVSPKGGLSVYGLGRFPVTLYKEQWEALFGAADQIRAALAENDGKLKTKDRK